MCSFTQWQSSHHPSLDPELHEGREVCNRFTICRGHHWLESKSDLIPPQTPNILSASRKFSFCLSKQTSFPMPEAKRLAHILGPYVLGGAWLPHPTPGWACDLSQANQSSQPFARVSGSHFSSLRVSLRYFWDSHIWNCHSTGAAELVGQHQGIRDEREIKTLIVTFKLPCSAPPETPGLAPCRAHNFHFGLSQFELGLSFATEKPSV